MSHNIYLSPAMQKSFIYKNKNVTISRMSETLSVRHINDVDKTTSIDRSGFYSSVENGSPLPYVPDIINVFLFNSHGELIIQKRSYNKRHNPGLIDKSIGGHVVFGDTYDYTVMVETVQELQTPSIVLRSSEDFQKTFQLLKNYLNTVAIIQHVDSKLFTLDKKFSSDTKQVSNMSHIYVGIYDGKIKPVDREAKGILYYSLSELEQEIKMTSQIFTDDLKTYLTTYKKELKSFVSQFCLNN